jgi:two-component system phosphate regulon sensor histidine kinase PhoR
VALFVVAALGATFLVRVVRREAELSRLKMDFVSRVSHELKTPLALIRMYGDTLAMGRAPEPERVAKFAGIIAKEADRLTRMIDNVLDFSRMEAGTKEYRVEPTDLPALLAGVAETYEPHLRERGFRLELSAERLARVELDREAMTQCFINLVDNAVKYTDDGQRVVEVRVSGANGHAVIEFADRGIGVPEAERERIFQKFYRASTAGERPGAGLGLAMVRHFVEAHGGRIQVTERAGGGSVFMVTLPVSAGGAGTPDPEQESQRT